MAILFIKKMESMFLLNKMIDAGNMSEKEKLERLQEYSKLFGFGFSTLPKELEKPTDEVKMHKKKIIMPFNIRKRDLNSLEFNSLKYLFYGLHNLDMPKEMSDYENPDEIVAKYIAAYVLKRNNMHLTKPFSIKPNYELFDNSPIEFNQVIRKMDDCAYQYLGDFKKKCIKRFSSNPGDQLRRLECLEDSVKSSFIDSFFKAYRPSRDEQPFNVDSFYDPNCDGRDKSIYVNGIYRILNSKAENK